MKKNILFFIIGFSLLSVFSFSINQYTTTNAANDSTEASKRSSKINEAKKEYSKVKDTQSFESNNYTFSNDSWGNDNGMLNGLEEINNFSNIGNSFNVGNFSLGGGGVVGNDTNTDPSIWQPGFMFPWEKFLAKLFYKKEMRREGVSLDGSVSFGGERYAKNTRDTMFDIPETQNAFIKPVILVIKIIAGIVTSVATKLSLNVGVLLISLILLNISYKTFVHITQSPDDSIEMLLKAILPEFVVSLIISVFVGSGLWWYVYGKLLLNFSAFLGGNLSGHHVTLQKLPEAITKLLTASFQIFATGVTMSIEMAFQLSSIVPTLFIIFGLFLLLYSAKAIQEMITVMIEYMISGVIMILCFPLLIFKPTRQYGSGMLGATMAQCLNIIIMFSFLGQTYALIDKFKTNINYSMATVIILTFTIVFCCALMQNIKTIGSAIVRGNAGFVDGMGVVNGMLDSLYGAMTISDLTKAFTDGVREIAKEKAQKAGKADKEESKKGNVKRKDGKDSKGGKNKSNDDLKWNKQDTQKLFSKVSKAFNKSRMRKQNIKRMLNGDFSGLDVNRGIKTIQGAFNAITKKANEGSEKIKDKEPKVKKEEVDKK